MIITWENDWNRFVDLLAEEIQTGRSIEELSAQFSGKKVVWTGIVEGMDLDELAPNVDIKLPERQIDFGDGRMATVDGISLPVARCAKTDWGAVQPGAVVTFEANLGRQRSPFPPISVKTFKTGKTILMIRLSEGVVVE